uniref:Ionotropic glutamate receptor C-terminal domain-containing protein n=1 Tax=Musca domestica TaxID=7370 RepID=A0A1I8MVC7_MUSDO
MALNSTIALLMLSSGSSMSNTMSNETQAVPQLVNSSFLIDIVSSIHDIYKFHNFVFFISERLTIDTDTAADFFQDFWDTFPTVPVLIMIDNAQVMDGYLSTPSLCLVLTTERDDPVMDVAADSMRGIRYFKTLFILFPIEESDDFYQTFEDYNRFYETIRMLYDWVWMKQFINTALITVKNNVFILDPYPTPTLVNITETWQPESFFINYGSDLKGYVINTPIRYDLPRVFYMKRPRIGARTKHQVTGVSGKIFTAFISTINATFNESWTDGLESEPVDINNIIKMVEEKHLEISMHTYTGLIGDGRATSYPIGINDWCIMVPYRNRSPEHMYLQNGFQQYTWLLICFSILYITIGIWLCSPSQSRDLSLSFLQAICSTILIVPLRVLMAPTLRMHFIFILLFLMGFFITNLYVSKMASFLTTTTEQPQINSVQDVIDAGLKIMIMDYEYDILVSNNFPEPFMDLLVKANKQVMDDHRDRFNTSYGYSIQSDRWNFLNIQQRYLKKPLFRLSQICLGPYYHVFPLQSDSHLAAPLQSFIMFASQLGLIKCWKNEAFADALYLGYVRMMLVNESLPPLSTNFFRSLCFLRPETQLKIGNFC